MTYTTLNLLKQVTAGKFTMVLFLLLVINEVHSSKKQVRFNDQVEYITYEPVEDEGIPEKTSDGWTKPTKYHNDKTESKLSKAKIDSVFGNCINNLDGDQNFGTFKDDSNPSDDLKKTNKSQKTKTKYNKTPSPGVLDVSPGWSLNCFMVQLRGIFDWILLIPRKLLMLVGWTDIF